MNKPVQDKPFDSARGKPELREKVLGILEQDFTVDLTRKKGFTEARLKQADQILALFPDEEDELEVVGLIRKQERERIFNEMDKLFAAYDDKFHIPTIQYKYLKQALEGEK